MSPRTAGKPRWRASPVVPTNPGYRVIRRSDLFVEVAVTHYKPPGAAWAQLVILVMLAATPPSGQSI